MTSFADFALAHPAFVDCAQALMRRPGSELLDEVSERALLKLGGAMTACLRSLSDVIDAGVASGEFKVKDTTLLANTLYASGLGALMLARSGLVIRESAPGVPVVGEISAEQVKQYMVASALAPRHLAVDRRCLSVGCRPVEHHSRRRGEPTRRSPTPRPELRWSALEDRHDALAARGADGDQRPPGALLREQLGGDVDDPATCGRERVTRSERGPVDVEL